MDSNTLNSLPREKCMKCQEERAILLSSCTIFDEVFGFCHHKFCQKCFRVENINTTNTFYCPCCQVSLSDNMLLIDEALLIGEAATMRSFIYCQLVKPKDSELSAENLTRINNINKLVIEKLESALLLNTTNFNTLYFLFISCCDGRAFLTANKPSDSPSTYRLKIFDYAFRLLDHPTLSEDHEVIRIKCNYELACVFYIYDNYPAALKHAKVAYEQCLRSSDHTNINTYKAIYLKFRDAFAKLPPLRFAVGDEVEFLHELETGSEWKLGEVVELLYRERDFGISFSAPYRLQLLDDSDSAEEPPVYAWVKADLDRYVRKVGVRSIEDTRYQARLDAKVAELAQVFCSKEFVEDIYCTLAQDREFVRMLQSVWQIELSESTIHLYRLLVMYREPLVHTDSGYHVPSSEVVIAGIRAYFDPAHLSGNAAHSAAGKDYKLIRAEIIKSLQSCSTRTSSFNKNNSIQGHLSHGIVCCIMLSLLPVKRSVSTVKLGPSWPTIKVYNQQHDFTVPLQMSKAISKVSSAQELLSLVSDYDYYDRLVFLLSVWIDLHTCLENPVAGPACECPFVYFFVKYCLEQGMGVPKLALAIYDRMNMQLSREFIRCANPTCELNRLDKSTRHVRFKKCSRCLTVIYCSRECQTAHYPEHKPLCKEDSTGLEGS